MRRILGGSIAALGTLGIAVAALAAPPTRVRGTIASISGGTVAVRDYDGKTTSVALKQDTRYAWVVRSSLAHVKPGDFIGTAATGPDSALVAQEVVIFPDAMRGAGEGHYPWAMPAAVARADAGQASAAAAGSPPVEGTMTNGTVAAAGPAVADTMTNGTVTAAPARVAGGRKLLVTYDKDHQLSIVVPPTVPVVRLQPADRSVLATGEKVFIVAVRPEGGADLAANFVGVGKDGLMPPM